MTIVRNSAARKVKKTRYNLWFERIMALIATVNLLLVMFDLTYVPLRDFWLTGEVRVGNIKSAYIEMEGIPLDIIPSSVSQIILKYDDVKGIVPNRKTDAYLAQVAELEQQLKNNSLDSPSVKNLLSDLRRRSVEIIETDPFAEARKSGNLEKIKNRIKEHLPNATTSSKQAFWQFWSGNHLQENSSKELAFFNQELKPLFETNYYRHLGENGGFVNNFGFIDFPFGAIFTLEFLARTWFISRTYTGVSWRDAMLWRWYDLFLLFPIWRWLRVIPVTIRLNQAKIINLVRVQKQISQGIVAGIAEDITEVVVIRLINQVQTSIRQGDITKFIVTNDANSYIDLNNTNEIAELIKIFTNTVVERVLPKIKPEVEALLQYSVEKAIQHSPGYNGVRFLPGGEALVSNLTQQVISQVYEVFSATLKAVLEEDKKFEQLLESLFTNVSESFVAELKAKHSVSRIESLLIDLLEEVKVNYVERLSEEDVEQILEQTRTIRKITHHDQ